ncbi:DUF309 domain-containing protein [Peribacillus tepidiphilus]|uniref:DUF309 domain-containing protein n=1 Tax=Peribacillus tepidiphilus TaxID=2652445 RepID=UPI0012924814|nr:DUF309 domain-containing protein [Peribacillus tepidiphilus]
MSYPKEYISFLVHFHGDRDYFECHEILEEYWKKVDPKNRESVWVALILLAVSSYHYRRNNLSGAERTIKKSIDILEKNQEAKQKLSSLGIDDKGFLEILKDQLARIQTGLPYIDLTFPLISDELIKTCKLKCKELGFKWCDKEYTADDTLVHRHKVRDRTEVIEERLRQKQIKRQR